MIESLYILIITAAACSILGVFLVLRRLSMVSDAISHSVLLGIVIGFFITKDLRSVWLIVAAALFGVFTTMAIEVLIKSRRVGEDAAVGIIFPLFFSIAVILITRFARNVHLDTDMVLMGEVIVAPFNRTTVLGISLPKALVQMSLVLILNIAFVVLSFNRMKISTFDPVFSAVSGIGVTLLYYIFMGLVSLTCVAAFESVGAILAISFFIAPAASAYLISKRLKTTLLLAVIYAIINSIIGYILAVKYNVSMSGMCAFASGITFFITVLCCPNGIITKEIERVKKRLRFRNELLLLHIGNHGSASDMLNELGLGSITKHIGWNDTLLRLHVNNLISKGYVYKANERGIYNLTEAGIEKVNEIKRLYGLVLGGKTLTKIDTSRDDYIIAIYECKERGETATNKLLSEMLNIKAASVSEMIKKLTESEDVYVENKDIYLTEKGSLAARTLLTKHRLWEMFLVEHLGYSWQEVHADAEVLEHVTSENLKNRLNEFLHRPQHCPHGNEIYENHPDKDKLICLADMKPGDKGIIHKVWDDKRLLEYLEEKDIVLNDEIEIKEIDNFDNSVLLKKKGREVYIAGKAADRIMVMSIK